MDTASTAQLGVAPTREGSPSIEHRVLHRRAKALRSHARRRVRRVPAVRDAFEMSLRRRYLLRLGLRIVTLLLGVIQSLITFDGTLSSWWARIAIGVLLCVFCLMQRFLGRAQRGAALPPSSPHKPARRPNETAKDTPASAILMQSHAVPPFN